jgi:CheY-like chemotaxis protein
MRASVTDRLSGRNLFGSDEPEVEQFEGRVLVVDDSSEGRKMISGILRCMGLQMTQAQDGREACRLAMAAHKAGRPYHLILMDIWMPDIDGFETTALLRSMGYPGKIIALTSRRFDETPERCAAAGCDDQASKPLNSEVLADAVRRHLPARKRLLGAHRMQGVA